MPGSKILGQDLATPSADVAEALQLDPDERVYVLDILRLIDDCPFLLSKVYLPQKLFPDLFDYTQDFYSLSAIYEQYQIIPQRVKSMIRASFPSVNEAVTLKIPCNMPVLKIEGILKSQDNILTQYSISCYRGDLAKISVDW
jgi:GntR family transcriptional regulator